MDQDVFYVKETEAPSGYTATNAVWKVTAKENDVCAMLEVPNVKDSTTNKFVYVKVKKVESGTNKALQGAYFTVYKDADCTKPVVEVSRRTSTAKPFPYSSSKNRIPTGSKRARHRTDMC